MTLIRMKHQRVGYIGLGKLYIVRDIAAVCSRAPNLPACRQYGFAHGSAPCQTAPTGEITVHLR